MRPLFQIFHSFKFKITATVTLMVLLAAIGVGSVSLLIFEASMRQVLAAQEMAMLTSTAAFIDNDLHSKRQALKSLAEARPGHQVTRELLRLLLERICQSFLAFGKRELSKARSSARNQSMA